MICDYCDEKIHNEVTVLDFGLYGRLFFCDDNCKDAFIDNHTTNQVLDEELDETEDKYLDFK